jgi:hypothetical protein
VEARVPRAGLADLAYQLPRAAVEDAKTPSIASFFERSIEEMKR